MSVNTQIIQAPVEKVFEVLSDGNRYPDWVVGAKRIRRVDESWPAPGSEFHHSVGAGPLHVDDSTSVRKVTEPMRLDLEVRIRPFLVADVALELQSEADGATKVVMREQIKRGVLRPLRAALDPMLSLRNAESLRRLRELVETDVGISRE